MDLRKIRKLIELVHETGIAELEVRTGDEKIRIAVESRDRGTAPPPDAVPAEATASSDNVAGGSLVAAPMSGTFYRAPAPGEKPFVDVGDTVAVGDVLCIIESMKMMNKVESECAGEIVEVLLDNGRAIETGAGLFRIR